MTTSDRGDWRRRWASRPALFCIALSAAASIAMLPERGTDPARHGWQTLLSPAQSAMRSVVESGQDFCRRWRTDSADREQLANAMDRAERLDAENGRLRRSLAALELTATSADRTIEGKVFATPLVTTDVVSARVLGRTAQAVLQGRALLDVGSRAKMLPGAMVVDGENFTGIAMIDVGRDERLEPDRLAIAGRRVWGKLASVGPLTSVVRLTTDPGYRDLVELAHRDGDRLQVSARGVLVGNGEKQCRIEMVDATAAVAVDDEVYTATDGAAPGPLLYGRIAKAEHIAGQPHWRLWLEPALGDREPRSVAVLRMDVNPARLAAVDKTRE